MSSSIQQWEKANKKELQPPQTAWPTVCLFIVAMSVLISSSLAAIFFHFNIYAAIILNAISTFALFTVLHDASHRALSQNKRLNETLGSICAYIISPVAGIRIFRFIHMQHHRFTNNDGEHDPDAWCGGGNKWTLPLRWMTLDFHYVVWYLQKWHKRPKKERAELIRTLSFTTVVFTTILILGGGVWLLLLWLIPSRIASTWLALAFDFLPHYPHDTTGQENEYRATSVRPGMSWLMTPIFLSQNYHLVHHLYPLVPFYRYPVVWKKAKKELIEAGARMHTWSGEEIKPEEILTKIKHNDATA